ncbi:hypothetical protein GA0115255_119593 [Streptomyces sp. Ncost-T6T-2b]|nr:hypothetical protein GA0115255_119593 [Streptomyces sp. Ncost-T6T-2b]
MHVPINAKGTPEPMRVLSSTLNVLSFADPMALRMPHVSVEVVQDERVERLQRAHARLEFARAGYRAAR